MASRSPRDRLSKLFHKHEKQSNGGETTSPPASPTTAGGSTPVRKLSSRMSLRDVVHSKGRTSSKTHNRRISADISNTVPHDAQAAAKLAAARAMYPEEDLQLPNVAHQSDLSDDLRDLTLADRTKAADHRPFSEAIADRNPVRRKPLNSEADRPNTVYMQRSHASELDPSTPKAGRHSEDASRSNVAQRVRAFERTSLDVPPPLKVNKRPSVDYGADSIGYPISPATSSGGHSLSHKPDILNLRRSSDASRAGSPTVPPRGPKRSMDVDRKRIKRSSLDKPLPPRPSVEFAEDLQSDRVLRQETGRGVQPAARPGYTTELADKEIDLAGIIDLSSTEDATLHERWAPAVTHETVVREVHEIRHEEITREVHNHHIYHRVLPIVDIEVLPSRHFVPVEGGYAEIAEEEVPGRVGAHAQWIIAETVSKMLPESKGPVVPERFTARKFEGKQGDYKESMAPEGFKRTETWWVHPPTYYEPGAVEGGQTYPFYIGSPNPRHDGIRAKLPEGKVIGVSPLLAQRQRQQAESAGSAAEQEPSAVPPPVPPHKVFPADLVDTARAGPAAAGKHPGPGWI